MSEPRWAMAFYRVFLRRHLFINFTYILSLIFAQDTFSKYNFDLAVFLFISYIVNLNYTCERIFYLLYRHSS